MKIVLKTKNNRYVGCEGEWCLIEDIKYAIPFNHYTLEEIPIMLKYFQEKFNIELEFEFLEIEY